MVEGGQKFVDGYYEEDTLGITTIVVWRPTNMKGPCWHMPLAMCACDSLIQSDIVPNILHGVTAGEVPSTQLALKYDETQMWYYFPGMTNNEVIIFK
jgi:hypothetical protein